MRSLIFHINVTPDGRCDHSAVIADDELHRHALATLEVADTVLFGRPTYQLFESYWPKVAERTTGISAVDDFARKLEPMSKVVFSKTLTEVSWNTRIVRDDPVEEVLRLKQQRGKSMVIFGSPTLAATLRNAQLIDEYRFLLQPMVVGTGPMLFGHAAQRLDLKLQSASAFQSGVVALHYLSQPQS